FAAPPSVKDASEDEVHLVDGSVHKGHLVGVSLGEIDIMNGSYEREDVAWIHFAGAPSAIAGQEAPRPPPPPPPPPPPKKDETDRQPQDTKPGSQPRPSAVVK